MSGYSITAVLQLDGSPSFALFGQNLQVCDASPVASVTSSDKPIFIPGWYVNPSF